MKVNNNGKSHKNQRKKVELSDLQHLSIQQLINKAIKAYQQNDIVSQDRWSTMLAKSGTKKDKISAAGALILENPQSCLKYFDMFIKWCFDKNHNFAITACQGLSNVYNQHIFSDKSSLKDFTDSVQTYIRENKKNCQVSNAQLIAFYLQSEIKQYYSEFIKAVQLLLASDLNHIKKSCVKILGSLAKHKQLRRTILALIINKLGDTDMDVVNQVSKCLKDEFYQDLLASEVLMEETQRFLFRPNLPQKAQFFVINFLNNINLKYLNEKSINKLFQIFYHFFTKSVGSQQKTQKTDELGSRLFLNSIKGLNRVFSFMRGGSKETKRIVQQKIEDVYRIVHVTPNIKAKIQLLLFLFQSHAHLHGNISSNNRFYRVLYEFISKDEVMHTSLSEMFFDLILVCMKEDENLNRVLAMAKRMLQLCFGANSNFIITTLLMLDKIIESKDGLRIVLQKQQNTLGDQTENHETYDINKRDPLYSGADRTCLWQLRLFCSHYHPTVRKFAQSIVSGQRIQYEGSNPLLQFNLTSFIQKMSLRKQKKSEAWRIKVKRNLSKIRSSKYTSLLNKQIDNFTEGEEFIKKYLQIRETVHTNKKKIQTNDIQEYADQVIEKQMDRLNPQEGDDQLSITPVGSQFSDQQGEDFDEAGSWDEQGQEQQPAEEQMGSEELEQGEDFDMDADQEQLDEMQEEGLEDKQFEDVFNEIQEQESFEGRNKVKKSKGFGKKSKPIQKKWKRNGNIKKKQKFKGR